LFGPQLLDVVRWQGQRSRVIAFDELGRAMLCPTPLCGVYLHDHWCVAPWSLAGDAADLFVPHWEFERTS
jgi:hypothetical protein